MLARIQFASTTIFHFIFVPLSIGLAFLIAIMETMYVVKGQEVYKKMAKFWGKLFLINFAVGVVTGILQEFQFGMNWSDYSVNTLLEIKENRRLDKYTVDWQMELFYEEPLLYLMGRINESSDHLREWYAQFQENGRVRQGDEESLRNELARLGGYLHVIDREGRVVQTVGSGAETKASYHPLEIMAMQEQPGTYATHIAVYRDAASGSTWVYHTPQDGALGKRPMMNDLIRVALWTMICVLLLSLGVAIWHGYRYSRPLLLFTGWFERMGRGAYEEVLTPKDRKRVFRRNGKLRMRFKLYKEVIHSFYKMAEQLAETERERERLDRNREEWMSVGDPGGIRDSSGSRAQTSIVIGP